MTADKFRKTTQTLMPVTSEPTRPGQYNPYPAYPIAPGLIGLGYDALAEKLAGATVVTIDGYPGVLWEDFRARLDAALVARGIHARWTNVEAALYSPEQIDQIIAPFMGGNDPLFGTRFTGTLRDFFDPRKLDEFHPDYSSGFSILYGIGAALAQWDGVLVYVDVPKNEIQFRARAGSVKNLGAASALDPKLAYKRSYFVDWVAANHHKAALLPGFHWVVDGQRPDQLVFMPGDALRASLHQVAHSYFRVRPWFEPGPWGGQWIKAHIPQLAQDVPNYAWSFELIVPENGLVFESSGRMLEISFDTLMFQEYQAVLGDCAANFKYEFPIRYDLLDTFDGGNLSVQCHPRPAYIRTHFGETFTQDECYYILDCTPQAQVYIGFCDGIDPDEFKTVLQRSAQMAQPVDIEHFVNAINVHKHDLMLIPNGTVHGAGRDNLVLEISATPYIFTFKMYDWLRLGLDGKPRSLNIERAFENLYFDRQGDRIEREFVSHPKVIATGADWQLVHLPTHPNHFYDVHRLEFNTAMEVDTAGSAHVLSLVEGKTVWLETSDGSRVRFSYAETFVVPAATGHYRLINDTGTPIKVVKTFVKPAQQWVPGVVPEAPQ